MKQEENKPDVEDIIREGLRAYREKEESAVIDELSRLSKEGHILIIQLAPRIEKQDDGITLKSALKITLPKYEKLKAENEQLKVKLEKAKEALAFYADCALEDMWEPPFNGGSKSGNLGDAARATLKEIEQFEKGGEG